MVVVEDDRPVPVVDACMGDEIVGVVVAGDAVALSDVIDELTIDDDSTELLATVMVVGEND